MQKNAEIGKKNAGKIPRFLIHRVFMRSKLAAFLLLTIPALSLQWERETVECGAAPFAPKVEASFRFTNTSSQTVHLLGVQTSCGCTVATPAKREYAPGEKGVLPVTHDPRGRTGTHAYRITVQTDEGGRHADDLTLQVVIAQQIEAGIRVACWETEEARTSKTVSFRTNPATPVKVTGIKPEADCVRAELIQGQTPDEWQVKITPLVTKGRAQTRIRLETDPPLADPMSGLFFAILR